MMRMVGDGDGHGRWWWGAGWSVVVPCILEHGQQALVNVIVSIIIMSTHAQHDGPRRAVRCSGVPAADSARLGKSAAAEPGFRGPGCERLGRGGGQRYRSRFGLVAARLSGVPWVSPCGRSGAHSEGTADPAGSVSPRHTAVASSWRAGSDHRPRKGDVVASMHCASPKTIDRSLK